MSNTKIDSMMEIEFDCRRGSSCSNLTFEYKLYDSSGTQVDAFSDTTGGQVDGARPHHFDVKTDSAQPIDSRSSRFETDPTCHD